MVKECIFDYHVLPKAIPKLGFVRFPLPCSSREASIVPIDFCYNHVCASWFMREITKVHTVLLWEYHEFHYPLLFS